MRAQTHSLPGWPELATTRWNRQSSREHAHIFALISIYLSRVRGGTALPRLLPLIESITRETALHCRAEEDLFEGLGHPNWAMQCQSHRKIMRQLTQFRRHLAAGLDVPRDHYEHLFDALIVHQIRETTLDAFADPIH